MDVPEIARPVKPPYTSANLHLVIAAALDALSCALMSTDRRQPPLPRTH
jgi:hypothetical protein